MKHMIIGTSGHVDHGKTALIKALTQIECDTHKEEKDRGITINLGFAHLNLSNGTSVGIVDVPGHHDFIDTMVSGASGIDLVMMVIAADSGIMPQTIEHLNIINTLGVKSGIIVITKSDLVDEDFIDLVKLEIQEQFENTVLENAEIITVSSIKKTGIDNLIKIIEEKSNEITSRPSGSVFRMFPDRLFNIKGHGFVFTGSVISGSLNKGDEVFLLPSGEKSYKVRGMQRHASDVEELVSGDRAAINLSGLKQEDFKRGMVLTKEYYEPVSMIDANLELFGSSRKLKRWSGAIFYSGTFRTTAKIHLIDCDNLKPGNKAIVQIHLEDSGILFNKDRFILRSGSGDSTIGGGVIFDNKPLHHRKRTKKLLESVDILSNALYSEDLILSLINLDLKKDNKIKSLSELSESIGKSEEEIREFVKEGNIGFENYSIKDDLIFVSTDLEQSLVNHIISILTEWHKSNYLLPDGISTRELLSKLKLDKKTGTQYLSLLLEKLKSNSQLKFINNTWVLFDYEVRIDEKTKSDIHWLEEIIKDYGVQKPIYADIESKAFGRNIKKDKLKMILYFLGRERKIYFHEKEFVHSTLVNKVRPLLINELKRVGKGINEGEFRSLFDGTKKIIPPLLGIFIKEGIITRGVNIINITDKGLL